MRCPTSLLTLGLLLGGFQAALAVESADSLDDAILPLIQAHEGTVGAAARHLGSGVEFRYQADRPMPTASLVKLPVMVAAYAAEHAGRVSLDDGLELKAGDLVPGSRVLAKLSPGATFTLRDAIRMMIADSDNTATNLVLERIGLESVNATLDRLGLPGIRIHSPVYRRGDSVDLPASQQFGLGRGTAAEFVRLAELIETRDLERRGEVAEGSCQEMLDHLRACEDRAMSPRDLPAGVTVAHKTGWVSGIRTDAGIIETKAGPIAFSLLTTDNRDQRGPGGAADDLAARFAAELVAYFLAASPPAPGPLAVGARGELVADVQRTLNARLPSDATITVDGDFGPGTAAAVRRFQESAGLPVTGGVDEATWGALGQLVTAVGPIPDRVELSPRQPADPLQGPPFVTAKAWAIVDVASGKVVAGLEADAVRQPASIVKVMTALLVLEAAAVDAAVLEETIHVSERAGTETGSSAGLRPGDRVTVGDLLYGLMLPSGNDAAVAFAEHFGPRLHAGAADAHDRFVAAMNARAASLGLESTRYGNPHGKTVEGCGSTATETALLVRTALAIPRFREIVGTRERWATLPNQAGYSRPVVWRNTNRLLGIEGYSGVKTGTTFAAGCCLASCGERSGRELIVVVLGSSSSDARYTDTRNLFQYGWGQSNPTR
jgi:D-alanyl-D-alanine carboxypeptidase (penicillin-binding protein 5/6)